MLDIKTKYFQVWDCACKHTVDANDCKHGSPEERKWCTILKAKENSIDEIGVLMKDLILMSATPITLNPSHSNGSQVENGVSQVQLRIWL